MPGSSDNSANFVRQTFIIGFAVLDQENEVRVMYVCVSNHFGHWSQSDCVDRDSRGTVRRAGTTKG